MPGLARGGGDLGRRAGRDGPRAAASGAPAAAAPAAWPGPARPHLLAAAGCGSPRCRLSRPRGIGGGGGCCFHGVCSLHSQSH